MGEAALVLYSRAFNVGQSRLTLKLLFSSAELAKNKQPRYFPYSLPG